MLSFDGFGNPENPALVLLHGAAALDEFTKQYCFQDRFYLIRPHLPGAGDAVNTPYQPEQTADAIATLIQSVSDRPVLLMGHSVGAELAVRVTIKHASLIQRAVFLSPWLFSNERSVRRYAAVARASAGMLKSASILRLQAKYWGYTAEEQARFLAYAPQIPKSTYESFYTERTHLDELPGYADVNVPMLALCGKGETRDTRASIEALGARNKNCRAKMLSYGSHDFLLRESMRLNPLLLAFLEGQDINQW